MLRPKLREGLRFSIQEQGGRRVCIIEDPHASKFHRVGLSEYAFLRALDGANTVEAILEQRVREGGGEAFTEVEAHQILRWAHGQGLLAIVAGRSGESKHSAQKWSEAFTWINPLILKIPMARPDAFFERLTAALSPAFGVFGAGIWLATILTGVTQILLNRERFAGSFDGILARDNWLWLGLSWVFLKTIHELAHGVSFKYFGAGVREIGVPLVQWAHSMAQTGPGEFRVWFRIALRVLVAAGVLAAILTVPFHKTVISPGVIEYADTCVVRAECPGFVKRVLVKNGDTVKAGDPLLELQNEELTAELEQARLAMQGAQLRARLAYTRADVASFQQEETRAKAESKTCEMKSRFLSTLIVRAPIAGRVLRRNLDETAGLFFKTGDEILRMGRADEREVALLISQENVPHFRSALNRTIQVKIEGRPEPFPATLERIDAAATREVLQPALTALSGGPLALRRAAKDESASGSQEYELAEPHFRGTALLKGADDLPAGETARLKIRSELSVSLWGELQGAVGQWLEQMTSRRGD